MRHRRLGSARLAILTLALAACGSGGTSGAPSVSATPAASVTPAATATPSPSEAPTPSPDGGAGLEPMLLLKPDALVSAYATGVNAHGWISIHYVEASGPMIVLAPDAGPDAGEAPVPGCPVGAAEPSCARTDAEDLRVGESDWYVGRIPRFLGSTTLSLPTAFGPGGEVVLLEPCCDGIEVSPVDVIPIPGPRFLGSVSAPDPAHPEDVERRIAVPVLWRTPGDVREVLPTDGLELGAAAVAGDAGGRIAGEGRTGEDRNSRGIPVVWEPRGDAYALVRLPLVDGGTSGAALAIDAGRIAGWSDGQSGRTAVVWEVAVDRDWNIDPLPMPEDFRMCTAVAVSGERVAGNCALASLRERAVVWRRATDGWRIETLLDPPDGIDSAYASAMSGDLVVGVAGNVGGAGTAAGPVAWRLPREEASP